MPLKLLTILFSLFTLILSPSMSQARKSTLTDKTVRLSTTGHSKGLSSNNLRSLINMIDNSFTIKLPGHATRVGATILATKGKNQSGVIFTQDYLSGPIQINEFAYKVSKALVSGNEMAGLPKNLDLKSAQKVIVGLLTALLLIQSEDVPTCKIGPTKVGFQNVTGCASSSSDLKALQTYFVNKGIQSVDIQLYEKARRLMFSMLAGAGILEYQKSRTHNLSLDSAYAKLWMSFLEKVNSQGDQPKPVVAFIEAFDELHSSKTLSSASLSTILATSAAENRGKAMDSFFSACAPRVGI